MRVCAAIIKLTNTFHPHTVHKYLNGGCFEFYLKLKEIFPQAIAYYDGDHVITKIGGKFYDASGEVECGRHIEFKKNEPELYDQARYWLK